MDKLGIIYKPILELSERLLFDLGCSFASICARLSCSASAHTVHSLGRSFVLARLHLLQVQLLHFLYLFALLRSSPAILRKVTHFLVFVYGPLRLFKELVDIFSEHLLKVAIIASRCSIFLSSSLSVSLLALFTSQIGNVASTGRFRVQISATASLLLAVHGTAEV